MLLKRGMQGMSVTYRWKSKFNLYGRLAGVQMYGSQGACLSQTLLQIRLNKAFKCRTYVSLG